MSLMKLIGPIVIGGVVGVSEFALERKCGVGPVLMVAACVSYVVGYLDKDLTNYLNSSRR